MQQVLKRLQNAFDRFFERLSKGEKAGYPRFKSKNRYHSFTYPQGGWELNDNKLWLSKIGTVRVRISRPIEGKIKTVTLKREADRWYVIFSCECVQSQQEATGKAIGIDVGLEHFLTTDIGKTVDNPRHLRNTEKKLAKAQRKLSRKKRGSKNRNRARKKVARLHSKIKNQRKDFAHKLSRKIVDKHDLIVYENLNIAGMVKNPHLAKSISDAGWAMFFNMLDYKAAEAGRLAIDVAPHHTSQNCSGCHKQVVKALSERLHKCPFCGLELSRDHNAAKNILARGVEILVQAGGLPVSAPGGLALARLLNGEPSHLESSFVNVAL